MNSLVALQVLAGGRLSNNNNPLASSKTSILLEHASISLCPRRGKWDYGYYHSDQSDFWSIKPQRDASLSIKQGKRNMGLKRVDFGQELIRKAPFKNHCEMRRKFVESRNVSHF